MARPARLVLTQLLFYRRHHRLEFRHQIIDKLEDHYCNMSYEESQDNIYKVVVNHEEQYSIWPADRENPLGWRDAGKTGTKAECLAYVKEVWTDMRPLSLRKKMEEANQNT
jgi:MbtH protein